MALTNAQLITLRNYIAADPILSQFDHNSDGAAAIADLLNVGVSEEYYVWRDITQPNEIIDTIMWSEFTQTDAIPAVADDVRIHIARSLVCQGKQLSLQTLLVRRDGINTGLPNIRFSIEDALTNIPSGASGALVDAGWGFVKAVISRKPTVFEKIYSTGIGSSAAPADMPVVGPVSYQQIVSAWAA